MPAVGERLSAEFVLKDKTHVQTLFSVGVTIEMNA